MIQIKCCRYCTTEQGRHPGCHDTCEKYLAERAAGEAKKAKDKGNRDLNVCRIESYNRTQIKKFRQRRHFSRTSKGEK